MSYVMPALISWETSIMCHNPGAHLGCVFLWFSQQFYNTISVFPPEHLFCVWTYWFH